MLLGPFRVFPGPTQPVLGQLRPFLGASALPGQVKLVLGRSSVQLDVTSYCRGRVILGDNSGAFFPIRVVIPL